MHSLQNNQPKTRHDRLQDMPSPCSQRAPFHPLLRPFPSKLDRKDQKMKRESKALKGKIAPLIIQMCRPGASAVRPQPLVFVSYTVGIFGLPGWTCPSPFPGLHTL